MTDSLTGTDERELEILEHIYSSTKDVRQRDLAKIVGLSLGMTNVIFKRLAQKGFLTIRKVNNRNIRYIVSPEGVEAITRRSYGYFRRTIKNVVYYRRLIERLVRDIKARDFNGIVLIGNSDLDFIVEHACGRFGVDYVKNMESFCGQLFRLYSESYIPDDETKDCDAGNDLAFMQDVLAGE
jgi:DNA-binding MarR family transcriptional regulator